MRKVLSISLTPETEKAIKNKTKKKGFDSVSSYIKYLISIDEELTSEEDLLKKVEKAEKEYKKGKFIKADSMTELYNEE